MKNFLTLLAALLITASTFAQVQYVSFPYKNYKIGFKAPSDFQISKNTVTDFSVNSTERKMNFTLRPVKEDASIDVSSAVELAKMSMVDVNASFSSVAITEEADVLLSSGLSGYYLTGTALDGSVKINFFAIGVYDASSTMQFKGIASYPVNRSSASNYDICKRILQSMQKLP